MNEVDAAVKKAHELLLIAALALGERARGAWHEWELLADWKHKQVDAGSHRLLALVYRNMSKVYPDCPALSQLKGIYRKSWFENTRLWRLATPAVRTLTHADIPVLVPKGVSLATLYYGDRGARAMQDVDILVPQNEAERSADALEEQGWISEQGTAARILLRHHHAAALKHPSGGSIDLHRFLLAENAAPDADDTIWKSARSLDFQGLQVLAPSPPDELLIACIHGWRWNVVPPIRWIADAVTILRSTPVFDWDHFLGEARRRRLTYRAGKALASLTPYSAEVPGVVLAQLDEGPFGWFEVSEERSMNRRPGFLPLTGIQAAYRYFRLHGTPRGPRGILKFMRYMWDTGTGLSGPRPVLRVAVYLLRRFKFVVWRRQ